MEELNRVALARSTWCFISQMDGLWVRVLEAKYGNTSKIDLGKVFRSASHSWRSFVEGCKLLKSGLPWEVGDREYVRFSLDEGRLIDSFSSTPPP